jgi:hypothetical protein
VTRGRNRRMPFDFNGLKLVTFHPAGPAPSTVPKRRQVL